MGLIDTQYSICISMSQKNRKRPPLFKHLNEKSSGNTLQPIIEKSAAIPPKRFNCSGFNVTVLFQILQQILQLPSVIHPSFPHRYSVFSVSFALSPSLSLSLSLSVSVSLFLSLSLPQMRMCSGKRVPESGMRQIWMCRTRRNLTTPMTVGWFLLLSVLLLQLSFCIWTSSGTLPVLYVVF